MRSPLVSLHCLSNWMFTEVRDMHNISTLKVPTPTIFLSLSPIFINQVPLRHESYSQDTQGPCNSLLKLKKKQISPEQGRDTSHPPQPPAVSLEQSVIPKHFSLLLLSPLKGQLLPFKIFFFLFLFSLFFFLFFLYFLFPFLFFLFSFFFFFLFGNLMLLAVFSFNTLWVHWKWLRETGGFSDQQMYVTLSEINEWEKWDFLSWSGQCN